MEKIHYTNWWYAAKNLSAEEEKKDSKAWVSKTDEIHRWPQGSQTSTRRRKEETEYMKIHHYTVVFQKEPEGGYTVVVPALRGCVTWGKTIEEAKTSAQEAIASYLGSLEKDNESFPPDVSFVSTIDVEALSSQRVYA